MNILISACLLGSACRYDGQSKPKEILSRLPEGIHLIPICPEQMGGLPTPRPAAERQNDRVINRAGQDVTDQFTRGAAEALRLARLFSCPAAILKEKSPSCGSEQIYDGSFTGTLTPGDGLTAQLLKEAGIAVFGENQLDDLLAWISNQIG